MGHYITELELEADARRYRELLASHERLRKALDDLAEYTEEVVGLISEVKNAREALKQIPKGE